MDFSKEREFNFRRFFFSKFYFNDPRIEIPPLPFPPAIGNSPLFLLHLRLIRRISKQQISGQMESGTRRRNFYKPIGR